MEKEIQIIKDYVEGRINIAELKKEIDNNRTLRELLQKKENTYDAMFKQLKLFRSDWNTIYARYCVWWNLTDWLKKNQISYEQFLKYCDDCTLFIKICPNWFDARIDYDGILDKILQELPQGLSRAKQIAWGKEKLKEMFKYDKTYPRWVQGAEWPIKNGQPLVFSHQKKLAKDDERVFYYFYDPQTKEEEVVEQLY